MKYFGIIDKNVAAIYQLQWKIGNIFDVFLQNSVLCGIAPKYFDNIVEIFLGNIVRLLKYFETYH